MMRSLRLFSATAGGKTTTGLVGVPVFQGDARKELASLYSRILHLTERFPATSVLAQSAAAIATDRLKIVEDNQDLKKIETLIDAGQVEELMQQARDEISLLPEMLKDRVFDPLEEPAPKGQWESLVNTASPAASTDGAPKE